MAEASLKEAVFYIWKEWIGNPLTETGLFLPSGCWPEAEKASLITASVAVSDNSRETTSHVFTETVIGWELQSLGHRFPL